MKQIFKSYDVRGIYPDEINEDTAYRIGRALVVYLDASRIAIATDNRSSSPKLLEALTRGIVEGGADVVALGLLSTPMLYFASAKLDVDGAVMITASHNPPQYNGFKLCRKNAVPIGLSSGLADIRDGALANTFPKIQRIGQVLSQDIKAEYAKYITSFLDIGEKKFSIAIDCAHAMGTLELSTLSEQKNISLVAKLYGELAPPGTCPHEANPLNTETLIELEHAVTDTHADIGIAFDGDADRIGFVDELGQIVPMDLVTALLAEALLPGHPHGTMLYDLRSSRAVRESIEELGGIAHECKVGHANIKRQMIAENAIMAGELSGHYYFALGGYTAEMGVLPAIFLLNLMARTGKKLSELVNAVKRYYHSGEINLKVTDAEKLFRSTKARYGDGITSELDGIKVTYPDWWFSLRTSNTEPLVRLNLEANTAQLLETKRGELLALILSASHS